MRETADAKQAWLDYLAYGPDRSLAKLIEFYAARQKGGGGTAPTLRLRQLEKWSSAHGWQDRLQYLADRAAAGLEEQQRAAIARVMEAGLSQPHERVALLHRLAGRLVADLLPEDPNAGQTTDAGDAEGGDLVWVSETKRYGPVKRFNRGEFETLRGLLDDVAAETGGRVVKTEVTGANGGPVEIDDAGTGDQHRVRRIAAILDAARERAGESGSRRDRPAPAPPDAGGAGGA